MDENEIIARHEQNIARKKAALEELTAEQNWLNQGGAPIGFWALVLIGLIYGAFETLTVGELEIHPLVSWLVVTLAMWTIFSAGYQVGDSIDRLNLKWTEDGDKPRKTSFRQWMSWGGLSLFLLHVAYNPGFYFP